MLCGTGQTGGHSLPFTRVLSINSDNLLFSSDFVKYSNVQCSLCIQWALIASRINSILGLALDFYSIQQTLSSGGAVSAIKARCEMEVDRIEKQFDDCMAFLLRVAFYRSLFMI